MAMSSENGSAAITTLQKHIEDMRNLVQCKICLKPLYEPYMLSCGHTYCYSCLSNWFQQSTDRRRNCPDCRTPVKIQPAPNFLLRDLTHMFISRTELLPDDETVEGHIAEKETEAAILVEHKQGRGLFNGLFRGPLIDRLFPPRGPIRDYEDGVERCPLCAWEVEDGRCMGCGIVPDPDADIEFSEIDLSDEDSSSSEGTPSVDNRRPPPARFYGIDTDEDDDEDADSRAGDGLDPDQYDPHDDFIDDENEDDMDDVDNVDDYGDYPTDAGTPYSDGTNVTTETFEGRTIPPYHGNAGGGIRSRNPDLAADSSDVQEDCDEEEDEEEIVRPRRRAGLARRRARPRVIEEDEEEEEEEEGSRSEDEGEDDPVSGRPARHRRQTSSSTDRSITHVTRDARSETPDGSASARFSELDETATSEARSEASGTDEAGDESDDTAIPPQTGRARRQRLQRQRAARQAHAPGHRITIDLVTPPARQRGYGRPTNHRDLAKDGRRNRATPVY